MFNLTAKTLTCFVLALAATNSAVSAADTSKMSEAEIWSLVDTGQMDESEALFLLESPQLTTNSTPTTSTDKVSGMDLGSGRITGVSGLDLGSGRITSVSGMDLGSGRVKSISGTDLGSGR